MARGILTEEEIRKLEENPFVIAVSGNRVIYSNALKERFMEEYIAGKKPSQIFKDAGFDVKILGSKRIERASARWRESYTAGSLGTHEDGYVRHKEKHENDQNHYRKVISEQNMKIRQMNQTIKKQEKLIKALESKIETLKQNQSKSRKKIYR